MAERLASLLGIFVLLGIAYLCSTARRKVPWRIVVVGILLQLYLALFLVRPAWVPVMLTVAAGACLAVLAVNAVRPLRGYWVPAASGLGLLGVVTTIIFAVSLRLGPAVYGVGAVLFAAVVVLLRLFPHGRPSARGAAAVGGCLAVIVLIWWGGLPKNHVYLALTGVGNGITWVIDFAKQGADFVFGGLRQVGGGSEGFVFAINVSAIILLFSALMSVLYYVGFLPWLVGMMARVLHGALGVSGAESLATASNVFVGQTEAPLVIRPYLPRMTESEVMALMAGGFATIAGSVFGIYVDILNAAEFQRGAADLIAASVMSAPAAFVFAKLFIPETEVSETAQGATLPRHQIGTSFLDALAGGVTAGVRLAVNVIAMLIVFYALIKLLDASVAGIAGWFGSELTFKGIYSYAFAPFAFLMGVPWSDCLEVGQLVGTKTIFNEFFAFLDLGAMIKEGQLAPRSAILSTYALCGFANFMSIGIQIGGLSGLAPEKRPVFVKVALRAMIAGALACQLTACIVGVIGEV
ncbi:MAG: NupC/NupG family nucleoside CNT transporter [Planctomycetota bacterium]|jgi:CNT family concentrative nucleoside transporter